MSNIFDNSYLKAPSLPDENELKLLAPFKDQLDETVFEPLYQQESADARVRLYKAMDLLKASGWNENEKGFLEKEGKEFEFEILIDTASAAAWERITLPFVGKLMRLGIKAHIRTVDLLQYKNRLDSFEYDMIVSVWGQSLSPGNEQRYFWTSSAAESQGSMNYSGLKNPVIDALVELVIQSSSKEELITAVHALDRVLLNEHIVIPHWYTPSHRYMFQNTIGMPTTVPLKGANVLTWWKI